jgi:hypothetical protein
MAAPQDALAPLAPPPPTAEPVVDATVVPEQDERHAKFEALKALADNDPKKLINLEALIAEFIAAGHNPRSPDDVMFQILGISPEFLEGLLFSLRNQVKPLVPANQDQKPAPQAKPLVEAKPAAEAAPPVAEPAPTEGA